MFEELGTFMFEFNVVCRTSDFSSDDENLNLFPSTLKDTSLLWFMGLHGNNITTWAEMQEALKNKYKD